MRSLHDFCREMNRRRPAVQLEGRWMFIDKTGAVTAQFPAGIAFAEPLSDGLSLVTAGEARLRGPQWPVGD
jgi:hypothetical protein